MTRLSRSTLICLFTVTGCAVLGLIYPVAGQTFVNQPLAQATVEGSPLQLAWNPQYPVLGVATTSGIVILSEAFQEITQVNDTKSIRSLAWSPEGTKLVTTQGIDLQVWDWNVASQTLTLSHTLSTLAEQLLVLWSPTGDRLASLGYTPGGIGTIYFWDTTTWQLQRTAKEKYGTDRNEYHLSGLSWHPLGLPLIVGTGNALKKNAEGIVVAATDVIAYVIDAETGNRVNNIPLLGHEHRAVSWTPDGEFILVGGGGGIDWYLSDTGEFVDAFSSTTASLLDWHPYSGLIAADSSIYSLQDKRWVGAFSPEELMTARAWTPGGYGLTISTISGQLLQFNISQFPGYKPNRPPTANAGSDQRLSTSGNSLKASVTLDGTSSMDDDGSISTYSWYISGVGLIKGSKVSTDLPVGIHKIMLTIIDDNAIARDDVVIEVMSPSQSPSITSFILVDADTDEDIRPLTNTDTITQGTFTIRAKTTPATVGSVVFSLNDNPRFNVENQDAYALKGDDNGDYHAWLAEPGTYTITATPYTEANGQGKAGTPLTITVEASGS